MDDRFYVIEVALERPLAGGGQPILGLRQAADERLVALDVTGLFELARVHAEVAVGGAQEALEVVEAQPLVHGKRRDDPQPHALVDQPVEIESGAGGAFRGRRARSDGAVVPVALQVAVLGDPSHSRQPPWRLAMNRPNSRLRPPKPAARKASPQPAGANSAAPPRAMNPSPMIGTMRTENAPPVTTAVPYSSSHAPGRSARSPAANSATLSTAPAASAGTRPSAKRRPGRDTRLRRACRAFQTTAPPVTTAAISASASQTVSHPCAVACFAASHAASSAVRPTAISPTPETAVKYTASSIVWRMNRRLSIAPRG